MEPAKIMLPHERRFDICKDQVSASLRQFQSLPSRTPFRLLINPLFLARELQFALQDVYPGEHRAI
jgi:hypothetical protein